MTRRLFAIFLAALLLAACTKQSAAPPAEGKPAPDVTLTDLAGQQVQLSSLRGNVVVLNFWATWCPPCREEIPSMMRLNQLMAGKPFRMLAVSIDEGGKGAIEEFFKSSGNTLPAFSDPKQEAGRLYGITGVPETFVIDKKGVILKKVIGGLDWSSPEVVGYLEELIRQ